MKKILCIVLTLLLVSSMLGCAASKESKSGLYAKTEQADDRLSPLETKDPPASETAALESGRKQLDREPVSGRFEAVGDCQEELRLYLFLDAEEHSFQLGAGMQVSYAEHGSYSVQDGILTASASSGPVYVFEVKDENTLVLTGRSGEKGLILGDGITFALQED